MFTSQPISSPAPQTSARPPQSSSPKLEAIKKSFQPSSFLLLLRVRALFRDSPRSSPAGSFHHEHKLASGAPRGRRAHDAPVLDPAREAGVVVGEGVERRHARREVERRGEVAEVLQRPGARDPLVPQPRVGELGLLRELRHDGRRAFRGAPQRVQLVGVLE